MEATFVFPAFAQVLGSVKEKGINRGKNAPGAEVLVPPPSGTRTAPKETASMGSSFGNPDIMFFIGFLNLVFRKNGDIS
ncbi:hypothetical protein DR999_PMT07426 [Platysternon megacephalum]|uniref:Uncharacterized protein n=1 Tax=Platysternon megacephalum TaxID=55544 RepID=A0A4D9EQH4_9SAUR|nr:hypothetical protein DR999_PMT07426 [Platysternon megacephalum]